MTSLGMDPDKFVVIPNGIEQSDHAADDVLLPALHRETLAELKQRGSLSSATLAGTQSAIPCGPFVRAMARDQSVLVPSSVADCRRRNSRASAPNCIKT